MSKPKLAVVFFAAVMLTGPELPAESFGQACYGADGMKGAGVTGKTLKFHDYVQIVQDGLKSAAMAQLTGKEINVAMPTWQPLTTWREIKRNLDVYVNPAVSVETRSARFVSAMAVANGLHASGMSPGKVANSWVNNGVVVGVMVDNAVVGVTPEFAEMLKLDYRNLVEIAMKGAKDQAVHDECYKHYGYLITDKKLLSDDVGITDIWNDAPEFITWNYRSNSLPKSVARTLAK